MFLRTIAAFCAQSTILRTSHVLRKMLSFCANLIVCAQSTCCAKILSFCANLIVCAQSTCCVQLQIVVRSGEEDITTTDIEDVLNRLFRSLLRQAHVQRRRRLGRYEDGSRSNDRASGVYVRSSRIRDWVRSSKILLEVSRTDIVSGIRPRWCGTATQMMWQKSCGGSIAGEEPEEVT
jgi:hypothetical protein